MGKRAKHFHILLLAHCRQDQRTQALLYHNGNSYTNKWLLQDFLFQKQNYAI